MNNNTTSFQVGTRIQHFRLQKGWSINYLANQAGVSQSYLRDIELENKNPTIDFISLLCNALNITLVDFFNSAETDLSTDPLFNKIQHLSPSQRNALLKLLEEFS